MSINILNPPERVISNIQTVTNRMSSVDEILGKQRLEYFAHGISRILSHIEPSIENLSKVVENKEIQTEIVILLINAATELETAWNVIRLCNIPASQRQGRIASELIAMIVVMSLPVPTLKSLPRKIPISRCLQDHPDKTVIDCYKSVSQSKSDKLLVTEPLLKATEFFSSFLMVAETELNIPIHIVEMLRNYRKQVQHPASHGSEELTSYHFEGFQGGAAGTIFDKKRKNSYILAADEIGNIAHLLADILDIVTNYLRISNSKMSAS